MMAQRGGITLGRGKGPWPSMAAAALCFGLTSVARQARASDVIFVAETCDTMISPSTSDPRDHFEITLGLRYDMRRASGFINREPFSSNAGGCSSASQEPCSPVRELKWTRHTATTTVLAQVALLKNLTLQLSLPVVLEDNLTFDYARKVAAAPETSTIDPAGQPENRLFAHDTAYYRGGLGAMSISLRWSALTEQMHHAWPHGIIYFTWQTPWTSTTDKLNQPTSKKEPAPVGDGLHRLTLGTLFTKRVGSFRYSPEFHNDMQIRRGYLEPYVNMSATAVLVQTGRALAAMTTGRQHLGLVPQQNIDVQTGTQIVAYENLQRGHQVALQLGVSGTYYTAGRSYSLLSGPLQKLTYSEEHYVIAAEATLITRIAEIFRLRAGARFECTSDHLLTNEPEYYDATKGLTNPLYDARIDRVGQRLVDSRDAAQLFFVEAALIL